MYTYTCMCTFTCRTYSYLQYLIFHVCTCICIIYPLRTRRCTCTTCTHVQVCTHVLFLLTGGYAFLEATDKAPGSTVVLYSPAFTTSTDLCFSMSYHMRGQHMGDLNVYVANENNPDVSVQSILSQSGQVSGKLHVS